MCVCLNCGDDVMQIRGRGLCWRCYADISIRQRFDMKAPRGRSPVQDFGDGRPLPIPTVAAPGSEEKIAVLTERAMRGEQLFHDDDARINLT